ncbi:MAG: hypothetical protein GY859_07485 [Desulfobacterales bacterium]|nr:hypothetical protein [Desulfobacterales bacterium]
MALDSLFFIAGLLTRGRWKKSRIAAVASIFRTGDGESRDFISPAAFRLTIATQGKFLLIFFENIPILKVLEFYGGEIMQKGKKSTPLVPDRPAWSGRPYTPRRGRRTHGGIFSSRR